MKTIIIIFLILIFSKLYSQNNNVNIGKTFISPHLNVEIKKDTNIIYCSTFQIAWNELKKTIGDNVKLSQKSQLQENLNNGIDAKKYINSSDYAVFSGPTTKEFIDQINKQIAKKFNSVFEPIKDSPSPDFYLFYAFMYKNLHFRKSFEILNNGINFTQDHNWEIEKVTNVEGFGVNKFDYDKKNDKSRLRLLKQINAYISPDNKQYIIRIKTKENDDIILASLNPKKTLQEAIDTINVMENKISSLDQYRVCSIGIPELNFNFEKVYTELIGTTILNSTNPIVKKIIEAKQNILFQINKQGAIIKSKAKIKTTKGCSFDPVYNCNILFFAEPFFLIIKKHGSKYPYLALWIGNPDLMKKRMMK